MTDNRIEPDKPEGQTTDWTTLEEAAEALGKSVRTIRRMIQDGTLEGYKVAGQKGHEWRIKPVNVSDLESVPEGSDSQDEDDRLWQLLKDMGQLVTEMDGKIDNLVTRTGQLEALQKRVEQAERDRLETQVTIEFTNKQLAQMSERLHTAEDSREAAIKESSELKGQVQAFTTQVSDLMSKLAERPIQQPVTSAPQPDMTPVAEETWHCPEETVVSPEQTRTVKLILQVTAKNAMNCPLGTVLLARENIEKAVLSRFGMKQISNEQGAWKSTGEYELVFSDADDASLDQQIQDLSRECEEEASKLKCSAKCEVKS